MSPAPHGRVAIVEEPRRRVISALAAAGCLAPAEEAEELIRAAEAGAGILDELVAGRQRGEPLAWITGSVDFCGIRVRVDRGVYVPRAHTEPLARRAASLLPAGGTGIDLGTGSGAIAAVMRSIRPHATVLATDRDRRAIACARSNGVTAFLGDLDEPLPPSLGGRVDVMTAVVPYVPQEELHLLPRDVLAFEPRHALDGGPGGTALLERVAELSIRWLRPGGSLLLELGGDQASAMATTMSVNGFSEFRVYRDAEGYDRAIEAHRPIRDRPDRRT
jgi:release factor glutamine methyltransferase